MGRMSKLGGFVGVVGVVFASSSLFAHDARAEPASAYEVGVVWERFDVDRLSQPTFAKAVRFDTRAWFGRHLYLGGEADWGTINADSDPPGALARIESPGMVRTGGEGQLADAHVIAGTGATAGAFMGGAELASGLRYATIAGMTDTSVVLEARGRLDLQLGRSFSVGAVAGVDLMDVHSVSVGLVAGLRFAR